MPARRRSLQARLFWSFALVTVLAAVLPFAFSRGTLYEDRLDSARRQALAQAMFAKGLFETELSGEHMQQLLTNTKALSMRLTLTGPTGKVLRDSDFPSEYLPALDNHNDRPEIEEALAKGEGFSLRRSNTLGYDVMYAAVRLANGSTLRIGVPLAGIQRGIERELSFLSVVIAGVTGLCLLLSIIITRNMRHGMSGMASVVESISLGNYQRRLHAVPGREFVPLAKAVNRMAERIETFVQTTSDQQAQLEIILDSMHEGVLVIGPGGNIRRFNKALELLFPAVSSAVGKQVVEAIPVPLLQRRIEEILRQGAGHSEALHFELPLGRFLVAHLSQPVTSNVHLGAVAVFYDATEIMRLERVRRDFVSNVSHELRTPLTAITGYAETLMNLDDAGPDQRHFAEVIHKHGIFLAKVVDDLLALARVENTREKIPLAPVDALLAVEEAVQLCREKASRKSIQFVVQVEKGKHVLSNGPLLTQIFRNLFENACRYSPEGGAIRITATRREKDILFTVADNGPGIAPHELPRIFERFYQVEKQRNSATSGIGLAICKHIVERHGGRIWAESPFGNEATAMLFTLPLANGEGGREEERQASGGQRG